jgi:hypothetical protein
MTRRMEPADLGVLRANAWPREPGNRSWVLSNVLHARSTTAKAAVCTAIYPGLPLLLVFAVGTVPLPEARKEGLVNALGFLLWPVRGVAAGLTRLIDFLGPQGLDEPASMLLPGWAVWSLVATSVVLTSLLVFAACLSLFRWVQCDR